jgi:hypothetical protein
MEVATYRPVQGCRLRMTPRLQFDFPVYGCSCAQDSQAQKGSMGSLRPSSSKITTRHHARQSPVRPADLIDNYQIRRGREWICYPGAGDYHKDSLPGYIMCAERGYADPRVCEGSRWSCPTSPSERVLRRLRHQEHMLAVGKHYGSTRIYGHAGRAIGETTQQALPLLPQLGLDTISDDYGQAGSSRKMDLAASVTGACVTRMSLLWACWGSWRTWAGATPRYGADDYATAGSGPTRQSEARDSEVPHASRRGMCKVIALTNRCSFLPEAGRVPVRGR